MSALSLWINYNLEVGSAVKSHILSTQLSQNQLSLIVFNQFKCRAAFYKRNRLMKLSQFQKAWKDSNQLRKFIKASNSISSLIKKQMIVRLLTACFQAIRLSKETEKFQFMQQSLNGRFVPEIQSLEGQINFKSMQQLQKIKKRSIKALIEQFKCKLASYFNHWRGVEVCAQTLIKYNLKQLIEQLYSNQIHRAFNHWRRGQFITMKQNQSSEIKILKSNGIQLRNQVVTVSKSVKFEQIRQILKARKRFSRVTDIFKRRFLTQGLSLWNQKCKQLLAMEQNGISLIIAKIRKNLCFQGFRIYKNKCNIIKSDKQAEARCLFYLQTRQLRIKRKIYSAISQFSSTFTKQKCNFQVLMHNMHTWLKRRSFIRWQDQGNNKSNQLLKQSQNQNQNKFQQLNQVLGAAAKTHNDSENLISSLHKKLKDQAQRILANTFARLYYINAERGIRKWQEVVRFKQHQEQIIKRTIQHQRKQKFYAVKAAFKNWIAKSQISELKSQIKYTVTKADESIQMGQFQRNKFEDTAAQLVNQTNSTQIANNDLSYKFNKIIQQIIQKNHDNVYQSFQRAVFIAWRFYTKRQMRFIRSVTNTITKSLWQNGFSNISQFARNKEQRRLQSRAAMGMKRMYYKKYCREVLNRWRQSNFKMTKQTANLYQLEFQQKVSIHEELVGRIKDWTCQKRLKQIEIVDKQNIFQAWLTVNKWLKGIRIKTPSFTDKIQQTYQQKLALKKWNQRTTLTYLFRGAQKYLKEYRRKLKLKVCFESLQQRFRADQGFCIVLSNFASKFDNRMKESALQQILDFSISKVVSKKLGVVKSSQILIKNLNELYLNKMRDYLDTLRLKMIFKKKREFAIKAFFGNLYSRNLRQLFMKFKNQALKVSTEQEVNQMGPIVPQVLNQQQQFFNYKCFLIDQGYTPLEVQKICQLAKTRSNELLSKTLQKLRHYTEEKHQYLKPKMFDRWRLYVKMRKLVRYLLRNIENKLQPVKADLSIAFNRWKYNQYSYLNGIDKKDLATKCSNNQRNKEQLKDLEDSASVFIEQISVQRDELIENYLRAQRMGVSLGRMNQERAIHRGISRLQDNAYNKNKLKFEQILQQNINQIHSLKNRIQDFEQDNESLANENEELRQFSLDGYQLSKNVQSLTLEREGFSQELTDKNSQIRLLQEQSLELELKLRQAQEHINAQLNQSNLNKRRQLQSQGKY